MNKFLLGLLAAAMLTGCAPPMPSWACDDDGIKHPLCDSTDSSDSNTDEQSSATESD